MKKNNIEIKSKTKDLTILIPTLNEEFTIERLINEIIKKMKNTKIKYCIMITDNNSKDKTIEIASKKKDVLINICKKPGYGANLISGIKRIRSKYTIFFDADGSYNPSYIKILYNEIIKSNCDLVTYNRLKKQQKNSMPFLNKYLGTPILSFLIRNIYRINVYDNNAGMRISKTSTLQKLNLKCSGMEFASEMLIKISLKKLKYKEHTLKFRKDYRNKAPHLKKWSDGYRHLRYILLNMYKSNRFSN